MRELLKVYQRKNGMNAASEVEVYDQAKAALNIIVKDAGSITKLLAHSYLGKTVFLLE